MTITFSCGTLNFIESLVNLWNSAVMLLLSFLFYSTIIQTNVDVSFFVDPGWGGAEFSTGGRRAAELVYCGHNGVREGR